MKFFIFFSIVFMLISCADIHKGSELDSINQMNKTVDSINTVAIENKFEQLNQMINQAKEVEQRIITNYASDTIEYELGVKLDQYRTVLNSFDPLKKAYSEIMSGCKDENLDLKNLKDDIENGNGNRAKYEEYIRLETLKIKQLHQLLSDYINKKKEIEKIFRETQVDVSNFSWQLKPH